MDATNVARVIVIVWGVGLRKSTMRESSELRGSLFVRSPQGTKTVHANKVPETISM